MHATCVSLSHARARLVLKRIHTMLLHMAVCSCIVGDDSTAREIVTNTIPSLIKNHMSLSSCGFIVSYVTRTAYRAGVVHMPNLFISSLLYNTLSDPNVTSINRRHPLSAVLLALYVARSNNVLSWLRPSLYQVYDAFVTWTKYIHSESVDSAKFTSRLINQDYILRTAMLSIPPMLTDEQSMCHVNLYHI